MSDDTRVDSAPPPPGGDRAAPAAGDVERLRGEAAEYKDKYLRSLAEQQNAVRRAANAQAEAIRYANGQLLKALLPIVDDFERLLDSIETAEPAALRDGLGLIHRNLLKLLRDCGVFSVETVGRPFDPQVHEAMMQEASGDASAGTVVRELQKGYRLNERTLRPARVVISAGTPAEPSPQEAS